jgi:hypothetical protein
MFLWFLFCFALRLESCTAAASGVPAACVHQSFSIVAVLPSQLYSFAPAVISVIGHEFPPKCFVQLTPNSDTSVQSCSPAYSPSFFDFPCSSSTQYIATFSLPAQSALLLQQLCVTNGTTASSCSVDISVFSELPSSSLAHHCSASMARALVILPPPVFDTFPLRRVFLATCPILVTGSSSRPPRPAPQLVVYLSRFYFRIRSALYFEPVALADLSCTALQAAMRHPQ